MNKNPTSELPIFVEWLTFTKWLCVIVESFPKKVRFTFSSRLVTLTLETVELFVQARYSKHKQGALSQINLNLEKLRILLRLCYELRFLSHKSYEYSMKQLYEIGSQLGGWLKHQRRSNEQSAVLWDYAVSESNSSGQKSSSS